MMAEELGFDSRFLLCITAATLALLLVSRGTQGSEQLGYESDLSPPSGAEVKSV
jgi:hypothetical protein